MRKYRTVSILVTAFLLLGAMAAMLIFYIQKAHDDFKNDVTVNAEGVTEETLKVRDLTLVPTEKREYDIRLTCKASGSFSIFLEYEETYDGGMKPFVDVTVKCDGETVYEGDLTDLLDNGKVVEFEGELHATEPLTVTVCYEMPYEVGNEAQGTSADFDIHLKIKKS